MSSGGEQEAGLKRVLGLPAAILLVAGSMIGSGVYKKIAPMSQVLSGEPAILLAWAAAGVITMFGAFTYAGLSGLTSGAGGVYEYLRLIYGRFTAFLFGWATFTIIGSGSIAGVAYVFAQSVNTLVPMPAYLVNSMAIVAILLLTWLNYRGVQNGGRFNTVVTMAKVLGIVLLVTTGFIYHPAVKTVEVVTQPASPLSFLSAFLAAMLSAFWAYDGWANITYIAGEIKNPRRNLPAAIIAGVGITIVLYILLNHTFISVLPVGELAALGENRVAASEAAVRMMGTTGSVLITLLIMLSTLGALNACILAYARVYFRMGQENFFFPGAARVHAVYRTPSVALLYSAGWSIVLVLSGTFDQLTNLVIFAVFIFFGLAAWGLIHAKRKKVIESKLIGYPFVQVVIILFCLVFLANTLYTHPVSAAAGLGLICSGIPLYLYFTRQR